MVEQLITPHFQLRLLSIFLIECYYSEDMIQICPGIKGYLTIYGTRLSSSYPSSTGQA